MNAGSAKGKVILAGAGPGDPELITLKALRYLQNADVVIVDRLVGEDLLTQYVKADAKIIRVGKQAGNSFSTPQENINDLLVVSAQHNQLVVRLKGGDVSFFSNVLDELKTLISHQIPYEIVPGITAASGAAAYAGIPLTARGYASAVRFLTYNRNAAWEEARWQDLAATDDTLVFYMAIDVLDTVVEKLLQYNISDDKYMAVIEQATTPLQKVHLFKLRNHEEEIGNIQLSSPSLVIVGKVTTLHEEFRWVPEVNSRENYFAPVRKIGTIN